MTKLSLIVPCYNEQECINQFFEEFTKNLLVNKKDYEFVFVDDGSKDNTFNEIKTICKNNPEYNIHILSFSRNFGKEAAMYAGLQHAKGEYVCIVDADLQQSPTVVNTMYEKLENDENIDCVAACQVQRNENKVQSWFKNCFYKLINRISEVDFKTGASDFRMFRREVANSLSSINEYHRFFKGIFGYVGFNTEYIEYSAEDRQAGISKWNLFKLFKYAFEGIISFSSFPLKIASVCGITASVSSMIYLIYIVIKKIFFDINVSGFATIVVLVLFLGGLQLFGLGLLGEYVGRIYEQSKNRPIYMLKEEINCTKFE